MRALLWPPGIVLLRLKFNFAWLCSPCLVRMVGCEPTNKGIDDAPAVLLPCSCDGVVFPHWHCGHLRPGRSLAVVERGSGENGDHRFRGQGHDGGRTGFRSAG